MLVLSNPAAPHFGNAPAPTDPGLQKISDIAKQLPKAVILPGIDYRFQNRQINVKRIPARKPLVHLDIPDGTEKRCGVSGLHDSGHFAFLDPAALFQHRNVQDFSPANFICCPVFRPIRSMVGAKIVHQRQHIHADKIRAEDACALHILFRSLRAKHADHQHIFFVFLLGHADPGDRREIRCPVFIVRPDDESRLDTHGIDRRD